MKTIVQTALVCAVLMAIFAGLTWTEDVGGINLQGTVITGALLGATIGVIIGAALWVLQNLR